MLRQLADLTGFHTAWTQSRHSALLTNVVADDAAGEAGEDRRQGGEPWPLRHVPIGRGGGAEKLVP